MTWSFVSKSRYYALKCFQQLLDVGQTSRSFIRAQKRKLTLWRMKDKTLREVRESQTEFDQSRNVRLNIGQVPKCWSISKPHSWQNVCIFLFKYAIYIIHLSWLCAKKFNPTQYFRTVQWSDFRPSGSQAVPYSDISFVVWGGPSEYPAPFFKFL